MPIVPSVMYEEGGKFEMIHAIALAIEKPARNI
jgi:hypothetical protein